MANTQDKKSDCQVCKRLIKEKYKYNFLWKIACIIFAILSAVFAYLYFESGAITTTTEITIDNSTIENGGDNGSINIGDNNNTVKGVVEKTDYTPIICISIIAGAILLIGGGIIIANNFKKNN